MTTEPSCAERISEHLASRNAHIRDLLAVAQDPEEAVSDGLAARLHEEGELDSPLTNEPDELGEAARERLYELPLGVETLTTFKVLLSTGGPADWYEVVCSGDTPNYEPASDGEHYEVERIVYHFADWFDHADQTLDGEELETATAFVRQVVPELVD